MMIFGAFSLLVCEIIIISTQLCDLFVNCPFESKADLLCGRAVIRLACERKMIITNRNEKKKKKRRKRSIVILLPCANQHFRFDEAHGELLAHAITSPYGITFSRHLRL